MGMFDFIFCEYPLPDKPAIDPDNIWTTPSKIPFQSKDFDCILATYKIDKNGLLLKSVKNELGHNVWKHLQDIEGTINFYTDVCQDSTYDLCGWIEYSAIVTDGVIQSIKCIINTLPRDYTDKEVAEFEDRRQTREQEINIKHQTIIKELNNYRDLILNAAALQDFIFNQAKKNLFYTNFNQNGEDWLFEYLYNTKTVTSCDSVEYEERILNHLKPYFKL